jgi:hypothetical protein
MEEPEKRPAENNPFKQHCTLNQTGKMRKNGKRIKFVCI